MTSVCARNGLKTIISKTAHIVEFGEKLIELRNIEDKLFAENWGIKAIECICHGDMNSGNIMVKPNTTDFSFIDFRHTGWHHRSRDFCSIEGSLRTRYPRDLSFRPFTNYLEREISLLLEEEKVFGPLESEAVSELREKNFEGFCDRLNRGEQFYDRDLVSIVRASFLANFSGATHREYCFAQLIHTWWLLGFEDAWAESQVELLSGNFLALLYFLWEKDGTH